MTRRRLLRAGRWVGLVTTGISLLLLTAKLVPGAGTDPPPGTLHTMGAGVASSVFPVPRDLDRWIDGIARPGERTRFPALLAVGPERCVDQLPLERASAEVHVAGVIADVHLSQTYRNEGTEALEVQYLFPTSRRAAVYALEMTVGERTIEAEIRALDQAREEYAEAVDGGHTAVLAERTQPHLFQMAVGNVQPGDEVVVDLYYTELLQAREGEYELMLPARVGKPLGANHHVREPADRPELVGPEFPTPFTFGAEVTLAAAVPITEVRSPTHHVEPAWGDDGGVRVVVDEDRLAGNRDLVLRYRLGGDGVEGGILLYEEGDEKFFLLQVEPPQRVEVEQVLPREYVFVLDVSGSMRGFPLDSAKLLMGDLLEDLRPEDRFDVVTFRGHPKVWKSASQPATKKNVDQALALVESQHGGGTTKLMPALEKALALPEVPGAARVVVVISDGVVEAEEEVLALIAERSGEANVFSFGVGSSVNRSLIEGVARAGQGEPFVAVDLEEARSAAADFQRYITAPVLRDIHVRYRTMLPYAEEPRQVADLFAQRPLTVIGRYRGQAGGKIVVAGKGTDGRFRQVIDVRDVEPSDEHRVLRLLWAQRRIDRLTDAERLGDDAAAAEIEELGLAYGLATGHTAFLAVDPAVRGVGERRVVVRPPSRSSRPSRTERASVPMAPAPTVGASTSLGTGQPGPGGLAESAGLLADMSPFQGGLTGSQYGNQYGSGGLSGRGATMGSAQSFGSGGLRSCGEAARATPSLTTTDPIVLGALELPVIQRVIDAHAAQFRYCYQKELNRNPGLAGRVTIKFVIAPDGTVSSARVDGTTLDNAVVEECLVARFLRLQFPVPDNGIVIVKYPFDLEPR